MRTAENWLLRVKNEWFLKYYQQKRGTLSIHDPLICSIYNFRSSVLWTTIALMSYTTFPGAVKSLSLVSFNLNSCVSLLTCATCSRPELSLDINRLAIYHITIGGRKSLSLKYFFYSVYVFLLLFCYNPLKTFWIKRMNLFIIYIHSANALCHIAKTIVRMFLFRHLSTWNRREIILRLRGFTCHKP